MSTSSANLLRVQKLWPRDSRGPSGLNEGSWTSALLPQEQALCVLATAETPYSGKITHIDLSRWRIVAVQTFGPRQIVANDILSVYFLRLLSPSVRLCVRQILGECGIVIA